MGPDPREKEKFRVRARVRIIGCAGARTSVRSEQGPGAMRRASLLGRRAVQIEMMPTDRLVPYIRNARTHSADQVAQIAALIAEFGFTNPILIGEDEVIIAAQNGKAFAPIELEGIARVKMQRNKGSAPRRLLFALAIGPPTPRKRRDPGIRAGEASATRSACNCFMVRRCLRDFPASVLSQPASFSAKGSILL